MKMYQSRHGQVVPVSNEEINVITTIQQNKLICETDLNTREASLADSLVSRGVLDKRYKNNTAFYAAYSKE